jgi:DNA helicase II / ATP-dependent DNA helicase PcrA
MNKDPHRQLDMFDGSPQPSAYQYRIFTEVASGRGNLLVRARAGTGKTWTILRALDYVKPKARVALFAFNKAIVEVLRARAPKGVRVCTLHSFGHNIIEQEITYHREQAFEVDRSKTFRIAEDIYGDEIDGHPVRGYFSVLSDLVSKAKDTMTAADIDALDALADRFGLDLPLDAPRHPEICLHCGVRSVRKDGCGSGGAHEFPEAETCVELAEDAFEERSARTLFLEASARVLTRSAEVVGIIDYGDMCWLPLKLEMPIRQYDVIFVDETQDLSPAQIQLLLRAVKPDGRVIAVGDDFQCLYAFRGADLDTVEKLKAVLRAKELPLPLSYRCSRAVADLAREDVPDFETLPDAPAGYVGHRSLDQLVADARPGDFIISRSNAPLLGVCYALTAAGKRAVVKGSDVQGALITFIAKFEENDVGEFLKQLDAWRDAEQERLETKKRRTSSMQDKYECARELVSKASSVADALRTARKMFVSDQKLEDEESDLRADVITLGTTHKLKGLEAERVWMLVDTYSREDGGEERNCWYVAVTRARTSLYLTHLPKKEKENRRATQ